jgi:8-oxo-dGTP diphosphatase
MPRSNKFTYDYEMAALTSDVIVYSNSTMEVLLIKRKNDPFKNKWAIPGGYIDISKKETRLAAAIRELKEETGIVAKTWNTTLFGVYDNPFRDPRGRTVTFVHLQPLNNRRDFKIKASDDAKEFKWFKIDSLPSIKMMAFDHLEILWDFKNRIFYR